MADQINVAAPSTAPNPAGGGYTFDADKIDAVIKKWQDLLEDLRRDRVDAQLMASVKPPGKEFASGDWESLANPSGQAFLEQNKKMQDYVQTYIDQLTAAKQKITTKEADTQHDLGKAVS
jgi:hypothetical protein